MELESDRQVAVVGRLPTNNRCERELRPAVIQRKVTNGYRAKWAAHYEADARTAISTLRLTGADPLHAIIKTITA